MIENSPSLQSTPLPIIANVSRVVTHVVDRITGDRVDFPLLVAVACVEALKNFKIEARVMYGKVAWVEIMDDQSLIWAGCWGENFHFWVATQFGEVVDLNTSVAFRKRSHSNPNLKALYSPPILWSAEVPGFYRYVPEGVAELGLEDLVEEKDRARYTAVLAEVKSKCGFGHLPNFFPAKLSQAAHSPVLSTQAEALPATHYLGGSKDPLTDLGAVASAAELANEEFDEVDLGFPNEPILCPGRKLLDDSKNTFRHFDRAVSVYGIPGAPF